MAMMTAPVCTSKRAQEIAGPAFCFHAATHLIEAKAALVPADCKGVLLRQADLSDLYARVPELDHSYHRKGKRRA